MRHRKKGRKLGRKTAPRQALRRHVVCALFTHGRIQTTLTKAKEFRPWAERLITVAKKSAAATAAGDQSLALAGYRRLLSELHDEDVARKLVNEIGPAMAERPGGYTRILKMARGRLGDNAPTAVFELVTYEVETSPSIGDM
jgi:large subunit ribosomal protein L17